MALNLKHLRPEEIRARIPQLEAEAARFGELGALCLAELKRRDAAFYRKALGPRPAAPGTGRQ